MVKYHLFILVLLRELFSCNEKISKIKIGLFNQKSNINNLNLIDEILSSRIYLNISLGTPPQITSLELDITSQIFCLSNKNFFINKSDTYEKISNNVIFLDYDEIEKGFNSKDILTFNEKIKKKVNFLLGTKFPLDRNDNYGIIGLKIPIWGQVGYPFFQSLKNAEIINSSIWTIKYYKNKKLKNIISYNDEKDNNIGEFIFGGEPHIYEKEKNIYNATEYYKVPALSIKGFVYWYLEFNNIYLSFKENNNQVKSKAYFSGERKAEIMINYLYMLGPDLFFEYIKEKFFWSYLNDNICLEKKIQRVYSYIECDYNSAFEVSSFPDISFEHIELETIFILTYEDLFLFDEKKGKYIFLILKEDYSMKWVLGSIFLKKYQLIFNEDAKTIGYYKQSQSIIIKEERPKVNNSNKSLLILLIISLSVLLFILGMFIQKKYCNKNRKIRANELEENFSYMGKSIKETKENIINDNTIKKEYIENDQYLYI